MTTLGQDFSVQMQRPAHVLAFQHAPEPMDLVRGLEKRVLAVNGCVLSLNDILDFADRFGSDIPDPLDMLRNKQEMVRIDVAVLDEAPGLLWAAAGIVLVHQATLVVHEAVQVAAGAGQALAEVVGGHLQDLAADRIAGAQDLAEREDQPLLAIQAKQHSHRAAVLGFLDQERQRQRARFSDRASQVGRAVDGGAVIGERQFLASPRCGASC